MYWLVNNNEACAEFFAGGAKAKLVELVNCQYDVV